MAPTELPIFELPLVLVPGELLPLHIFEERYRRMIADCESLDEPFGVIWAEDGEETKSIGCTARVAEILQRFDDGRMNIVVVGESPFRATRRFEGERYPLAEAELLDEDPAAGEDEDDPIAAEQARETFLRLAERASQGSAPDLETIADDSAFDLAARITLPPETKQQLLQEPSEAERMRMLAAGLEAVEVALARSQEIAERARLNGHGPLGS